MEIKKTAIIGAGICGLYLAWKLSEKGFNVTVFEKKDSIGKKACSGLFSERILDFIPESKRLVKNEISSALINFPSRTIRIKFSKKFLVMSHYELDNLVFLLAKSAGAEILFNHLVESAPSGFDRVLGCDGPESAIRKELKAKSSDARLGILGFVRQADDSDFVETWPVKSGFIWKIPRGSDIEYGIISDLKSAKPLFEEFLNKKNIKLEGLEAGLIPLGFDIPFDEKITLCGDACGLCKPWSGGGVVWGLIAADMLLKSFPDFLRYIKLVKKFFLPKILLSRMAVKLAYFLGFNLPWVMPKNVKIEGDFLL